MKFIIILLCCVFCPVSLSHKSLDGVKAPEKKRIKKLSKHEIKFVVVVLLEFFKGENFSEFFHLALGDISGGVETDKCACWGSFSPTQTVKV